MKSHREIMMTVIFSLYVHSSKFDRCLIDDHTPLYVLKDNGKGVWSLK